MQEHETAINEQKIWLLKQVNKAHTKLDSPTVPVSCTYPGD